MAIVLAADGLSAARATATDTDDGNWGAGQSYEDIEILNDDAQEAKNRGSSSRAGLQYV